MGTLHVDKTFSGPKFITRTCLEYGGLPQEDHRLSPLALVESIQSYIYFEMHVLKTQPARNANISVLCMVLDRLYEY